MFCSRTRTARYLLCNGDLVSSACLLCWQGAGCMREEALMCCVPEETRTDSRFPFPGTAGGPTQPVGPPPQLFLPQTLHRLLLSAIGKKKRKNKGSGRFAEMFSDFRQCPDWLRARESVASPRRGQARPGCGCVLMLDATARLGMDPSCGWGRLPGTLGNGTW